MSRTIRRNKKHLIQSYCGNLDELRQEFAHGCRWVKDSHILGIDRAYQRKVARFTRDHRSGRFGIPRWYRQMHGVHLYRRLEKQKIHKHLREDSFDNHLPEPRIRDSMYYWWY